MNEKKLLFAIQALGELLEDKEYSINSKNCYIKSLEKEVSELREMACKGCGTAEQYESTILTQKEYIAHLEAKIYDLEERLAIMTESESPETAGEFELSADAPLQPMWDIEPPKQAVTVVTEETEESEEEENESLSD